MDFWLNLMFGHPVGWMSMLVILVTVALISFYAGYFIYKVHKAQPPVEQGQPSPKAPHH
ncbi:DUF3149 domain-containing protein [Aeromonas sobria]|uniref:DUF3149 domain-containing protein n=1 Tax=Aeromonas sobria TaxID=646 RepID=UPI003D0189BB